MDVGRGHSWGEGTGGEGAQVGRGHGWRVGRYVEGAQVGRRHIGRKMVVEAIMKRRDMRRKQAEAAVAQRSTIQPVPWVSQCPGSVSALGQAVFWVRK